MVVPPFWLFAGRREILDAPPLSSTDFRSFGYYAMPHLVASLTTARLLA